MGAQSTLTILIQKVLAALPSTASVKRLFSVAGNVQNRRRTRFCPKSFSKLVTFKVKFRNINEYLENQFFN